jgi:L-cystine transport system permease protein
VSPRLLSIAASSFWPLVQAGLEFTIPLTLLSFVFGLALGLLTALARLSPHGAIRGVARFYVWIFRGTPLLVQLFLIFYGLPSIGILLDAFPAALVGFTLNTGAYSSETIRAAISSVHRGQWDAARALGMSGAQVFTRIVAPQAARFAAPPLANSFIALVKDTSLAATLTVPEMFQVAQRITAVTYEPLLLYTEAALIYLVFSSVLSSLQRRLEVRLNRHVRRA